MSKFMKEICKICKLNESHTNHCLRVLSINLLKSEFSDSDIMAVSGHTSVESLKLYERTTESDKEKMSDHLTKKLVTISSHQNSTPRSSQMASTSLSDIPDLGISDEEFVNYAIEIENSKKINFMGSCQQPSTFIFNGPVSVTFNNYN